ncbi:hypothetical protein FN846DRAFT_983520 [Sphaerosporella brunnea]|uniref:Uncharacterized protein n=1 Tax=Sphaerosporella brunnea TaxID=1250544 RepID=A0A5J5FBL0_9PEZI|nr:hypothetical protein FN846DRAFT_983520 [Sphaerosporella brunnea]
MGTCLGGNPPLKYRLSLHSLTYRPQHLHPTTPQRIKMSQVYSKMVHEEVREVGTNKRITRNESATKRRRVDNSVVGRQQVPRRALAEIYPEHVKQDKCHRRQTVETYAYSIAMSQQDEMDRDAKRKVKGGSESSNRCCTPAALNSAYPLEQACYSSAHPSSAGALRPIAPGSTVRLSRCFGPIAVSTPAPRPRKPREPLSDAEAAGLIDIDTPHSAKSLKLKHHQELLALENMHEAQIAELHQQLADAHEVIYQLQRRERAIVAAWKENRHHGA